MVFVPFSSEHGFSGRSNLLYFCAGACSSDAGASINTSNIGKSALIIKELDWGGQDELNTCENSFFGPHLGLFFFFWISKYLFPKGNATQPKNTRAKAQNYRKTDRTSPKY